MTGTQCKETEDGGRWREVEIGEIAAGTCYNLVIASCVPPEPHVSSYDSDYSLSPFSLASFSCKLFMTHSIIRVPEGGSPLSISMMRLLTSENCQFSFCRFFLTKNQQKPTKTSKTSQKLETWKRILVSMETISKAECENRSNCQNRPETRNLILLPINL